MRRLSDIESARESINNIRRLSVDRIRSPEKVNSERRWRLSYLKNQFVSLQLGELFGIYTRRINHGYFSLFLILQAILSFSHFGIVLATNMESHTTDVVIVDLVVYAILTGLPIIGLFFSEDYVKKRPKTLKYMSGLAFSVLLVANFVLPVYHYLLIQGSFRPAYTTHMILAVYVFFNIHSITMACILGASVAVFHLLVLTLVTYSDSAFLEKMVLSDAIYMLCINGLGVYFRFMNEIVKRRTFLDRRACVETTLRLKFEKEQEEQLMISIIPEHIISEVRKDFLNLIEHIEKTNNLPVLEDPFKIPYVNEHENVTILYADIVNYTEMTTKLKPVTKLVETLHELFGRFDEASDKLKVLRIKFLGDCYYCVAGLNQDVEMNHAEACVDLGLKMITIIRKVRTKRNLPIDMRIGIHSGRILSGLIGTKKWQFDVWSKDVDIANKMESTGTPGMVHITSETKNLLSKSYNIKPSDAGSEDEFLKEHNIETFLITPPNEPNETVQQSENTTTEGIFIRYSNSTIYESGTEPNSPQIQNHTHANGCVGRGKNCENSYEEVYRKEVKLPRRVSGNPTLKIIERRTSGNPNLANFNSARSSNSSGGRRSGSGLDRRARRSTPFFRRTAFMDNNLQKFNEYLEKTDSEMKTAVEKMPLSKYEQWFKNKEINPLLLLFKNWQDEVQFIKIADPLFKYYLTSEIIVLVCVMFIQCLSNREWEWWSWFSSATAAFVILILLPTTWTHFVWSRCVADRYDEFEEEKLPENPVFRFLYRMSEIVAENVAIRVTIYLLMCFLFSVSVFAELLDCTEYFDDYGGFRNATIEDPNLRSLVNIVFNLESDHYRCIIPWHMSETCALAIIMSFLFLRIHIWIKLLFSVLLTIFYSYCVASLSEEEFYQSSETYNYNMKPEIAHLISIIYLAFTLHLIDRQTDYMNRLDHLWNIQLTNEQKAQNTSHKINKLLLNSILPAHVAKLYLNMNRISTEKELYHENYKSVAVMFASVIIGQIDGLTDMMFLKYMNQIIGDFDKLLLTPNGLPIEKIKVAKWTYMAACGLEPERQCGPDNLMTEEEIKKCSEEVVISMLQFAVDMINALEKLHPKHISQFQLRIGIAHGELTAGVVGSKKPLYDIWGDPVNMASRMDSNGIPGKIQVPKETADIIMKRSIKCEFRDKITVKGIKMKVPTYFVCLDKDNKLITDVETKL